MEFFFKPSRQKDKLSSDINVDINKASRVLMFILISTLEVLWHSFWNQTSEFDAFLYSLLF